MSNEINNYINYYRYLLRQIYYSSSEDYIIYKLKNILLELNYQPNEINNMLYDFYYNSGFDYSLEYITNISLPENNNYSLPEEQINNNSLSEEQINNNSLSEEQVNNNLLEEYLNNNILLEDYNNNTLENQVVLTNITRELFNNQYNRIYIINEPLDYNTIDLLLQSTTQLDNTHELSNVINNDNVNNNVNNVDNNNNVNNVDNNNNLIQDSVNVDNVDNVDTHEVRNVDNVDTHEVRNVDNVDTHEVRNVDNVDNNNNLIQDSVNIFDGPYGNNITFITRQRIFPYFRNTDDRITSIRNILYSIINNRLPEYQDVVVSLDEEEFNKLPCKVLDNDLQENCCICIEQFKKNDTVIEAPCKHIYHKDCITDYLINYNYKCPICRVEIGKPKYNI